MADSSSAIGKCDRAAMRRYTGTGTADGDAEATGLDTPRRVKYVSPYSFSGDGKADILIGRHVIGRHIIGRHRRPG